MNTENPARFCLVLCVDGQSVTDLKDVTVEEAIEAGMKGDEEFMVVDQISGEIIEEQPKVIYQKAG